jgi:hypothetical protein
MPILLVRKSLIQVISFFIWLLLYSYFQIKNILPLHYFQKATAKQNGRFIYHSIWVRFLTLHKFAMEIVKSKIKQYITHQNHIVLAAGKQRSNNPAGILSRVSLADTLAYLPKVIQPAHLYIDNTFTRIFVNNQRNTTFNFFWVYRPTTY